MPDHELVKQALNELRSDNAVQSVWNQAVEEADRERSRAISRYVELRVEQLRNLENQPAADNPADPVLPPSTTAQSSFGDTEKAPPPPTATGWFGKLWSRIIRHLSR